MTIDIIVIILMVLFFMKGYKKGIIIALFSLLGSIIGMVGALKLSSSLSQQLFGDTASRFAYMMSFAIVFAGIVFIINRVASFLMKTLKLVHLGWANRLAGGAVYMLMVAFVLSAILNLGDKVGLIKEETKAANVTYPIIQPISGIIWPIVKESIPKIKGGYDSVNVFFDDVNEQVNERR